MDLTPIVRSEVRLLPDPRRVIARPFVLGDQVFPQRAVAH
jgi:hypothetical protein